MKSEFAERRILLTLLDFGNLLIVLLNFTLIFLTSKFGVLNILLYATSVLMFALTRHSIAEGLLFAMFYPFSTILLVRTKEAEIEDYFSVPIPEQKDVKFEDSIINSLPIKALLVVGSVNEKKLIAKNLAKFVIHGIRIEENMKYLETLLRDPHLDVVLYASQAMEDIENYFEEKIARLRNTRSSEFCLSLYYYLRTGIPKGLLRQRLEEILLNNLKNSCPKTWQYYEMMFYLTKDEEYLLSGYKKFGHLWMLRRYILEKIRKREYESVRELIRTCRELSEKDLRKFLSEND
ncbi:hypothetical protein [Fervidobacterium thailandense]|uniref:Uncharacterized protein n=1 Tax=Fervidobacterium thailandense TaxID=1008305 RepID=A0A1E3G4J0_9BACT|nr:hypothetical protein [Fervidobacterium thailandense]ODN30558.1 hypothetical protein A4H02_04750 [Fervidobacterium thailandense]